eukprot:434429_1
MHLSICMVPFLLFVFLGMRPWGNRCSTHECMVEPCTDISFNLYYLSTTLLLGFIAHSTPQPNTFGEQGSFPSQVHKPTSSNHYSIFDSRRIPTGCYGFLCSQHVPFNQHSKKDLTQIYPAYSQYMITLVLLLNFAFFLFNFWDECLLLPFFLNLVCCRRSLLLYYHWFYVIFWHCIYIIMVYDGGSSIVEPNVRIGTILALTIVLVLLVYLVRRKIAMF